MKARVEYITLSQYDRVIVVSDMHGHADLFRSVLQKACFAGKDALVILGDICNKGPQSLPLLRHVMALAQRENVHVLMGNNDLTILYWLDGRFSDDEVCQWLHEGNHTIIHNMADELNHSYTTVSDVTHLKESILDRYTAEIQFLRELPHIIESDIATFVHAGIKPGPLEKQEIAACLSYPAFADQAFRFDKPLIVGHWPTVNYCKTVADQNVAVNPLTNVISIDGGMGTKHSGQINYLILDSSGSPMEWGYCDELPQITALDDQAENESFTNVQFPNSKIVIEDDLGDTAACYLPAVDMRMIFSKDRIYEYKGSWYCSDFTTHHLKVCKGETLSLCRVFQEGILVKKDGIVGMYHGKYKVN